MVVSGCHAEIPAALGTSKFSNLHRFDFWEEVY